MFLFKVSQYLVALFCIGVKDRALFWAFSVKNRHRSRYKVVLSMSE